MCVIMGVVTGCNGRLSYALKTKLFVCVCTRKKSQTNTLTLRKSLYVRDLRVFPFLIKIQWVIFSSSRVLCYHSFPFWFVSGVRVRKIENYHTQYIYRPVRAKKEENLMSPRYQSPKKNESKERNRVSVFCFSCCICLTIQCNVRFKYHFQRLWIMMNMN